MTTDPGIVSEQLVIGTCLSNKEVGEAIAPIIVPDDFQDPTHQLLAKALKFFHSQRLPVETDTVIQKALEINPQTSFDSRYVYGLKDYAAQQECDVRTARYHAKKITQTSLFKRLSQTSALELQRELLNPNNKPEDIVRLASSIKDQVVLAGVVDDNRYQDMSEVIPLWSDELARRGKNQSFVPSGFSHLDYFFTEGFGMGKVSIIAGRPGSGKSSLADNIMIRQANIAATIQELLAKDPSVFKSMQDVMPYITTEPVHTALCALEMDTIGTVDRLASISTGVGLRRIIRDPAKFTGPQSNKIDYFKTHFEVNPYLHFDDTPRQSWEDVARKAAELKRRLKINQLIVFVDLFGKVTDVNENIETTQAAAYENTLRKVQIAAREDNIHYCLVTQIGRAAEPARQSPNKEINNRPAIRHLKNSGAFEEVADLILLLYRQKYYDPSVPMDICEVNIAKQRQGVMNKVVNLMFDAPTVSLLTTNYMPMYQAGSRLNVVVENDFANPEEYWREMVHPDIQKEKEAAERKAQAEARGNN